jgi:hypothetical protein
MKPWNQWEVNAMSETFYNEIEISAGQKLFFDAVDNRLQRRGFDEEKFKREQHWSPDPNKPKEVHPAVAREQARLKSIAAAEKVLKREVKTVPVGLHAQELINVGDAVASELEHPNVTEMSDYARNRDSARAA